ncbi:MAG: N-acetylmuramoyl-L-alanine amidase [Nitrospirae bacterium]|nr:N-acetylmuramoyl-L-alanine amidase [Nitrospirota bacterium]
MKRAAFLLVFILLPLSFISGEDAPLLKLRASKHPELTRIVLEGPETLIPKGIVNQRGQDISITFHDLTFSVEDTKLPFPHKRVKNSLVFSLSEFKRFKTTFLKSPARLVIDVYQDVYQVDSPVSDKTKDKKTFKTRTIVIDAGHGGHEYGVIKDIYREKDVVLDISKRLRRLILKDFARCFLTRMGDQFMSLAQRVDFSNSQKGDIFLSIHIGKHKEIVIYTPVIAETPHDNPDEFIKIQFLRDAMQDAMREDFGDNMVSIKQIPYSILSRIDSPALMIELPSFEDMDYNEELKTKLANTIHKGIYLYEKLTKS